MSPSAFDRAVAPAEPGLMIRSLGTVLPGVRRSGRQIRDYAESWRHDAVAALDGDDPVVVIFGDSLAQGIGAGARDLGYASLVVAELADRHRTPIAVLNLSRSGARIDDVLQTQLPAFDEVRQRHQLTVLGGVCTVGSNDLVRSGRLWRAKRSMTDLIGRLPDGVVLATVPDTGSMVAKRLNRHIREQASLQGRQLADVAASLTSWRGLLATDRFHPNDAGHALWARVITDVMTDVSATVPAAAATGPR